MSDHLPTVLLRHDLPDGSHHYDWLLARDPSGPLLTFRLDRDIGLDAQPFDAQRLPDHRRAYLDYQGPISGDRGSVVRVGSGRCLVLDETDRLVRVWLELGVWRGEVAGIRQGEGLFLFALRENR